MLQSRLFKHIDNSALIVFRVIFGLIIIAQSWGSIATGYITERIIPTQFTFNFIGFDFIQPFPGSWMYVFYAVMGLFGVGVLLGFKYRISMAGFTLMWMWTYLMDKAGYNNHYYLLLLLCIFMLIVPAHRYYSLDVKRNPSLKQISMPAWIPFFIILQMGIVYTFATVAKIYPDWLDATVARNLMARREHYPVIGELLQQNWAHWVIAYFGIFFDLLIVPLMLWSRTRKFAFIMAVFFHVFNSIIFQIGIFPYLAIGLFVFFFPPKTIHGLFMKKKAFYDENQVVLPKNNKLVVSFLTVWFIIQLVLPLRHWAIKDDVLWTEEGHRMSWRMMLRQRSGWSYYKVVDKATGKEEKVKKEDYLTPRQISATATQPDMIWQFAQRLKKEYAAQGKDVAVYVEAHVSINGSKFELLVKPQADLAAEKWNYFGHNHWLMPSPKSVENMQKKQAAFTETQSNFTKTRI